MALPVILGVAPPPPSTLVVSVLSESDSLLVRTNFFFLAGLPLIAVLSCRLVRPEVLG